MIICLGCGMRIGPHPEKLAAFLIADQLQTSAMWAEIALCDSAGLP
jgi:hypothetical protein